MAIEENEVKSNKQNVPMSSFMKKMMGIKDKEETKKAPVVAKPNAPKHPQGKGFVNSSKKGGNLLKKLSGK